MYSPHKKHGKKASQCHHSQSTYLQISMMMINNPSGVKVEETSTETNPVTQVALVAVNNRKGYTVISSTRKHQ